jgi:CO/xanthine dehydrogenase FAD-binding subunit
MIATMEFFQPHTIAEATATLKQKHCMILAGGTDIYPAHVTKPLSRPVLDTSRIAGLNQITESQSHFVFGANVTWSDLIAAPLPRAFDGLKAAAREVGSVQIQNRATLAGNICNASPAADGIPPLLTLNALIELQSAQGKRQLTVENFVLGNRKTALQPDEIVTSIIIPKSATYGRSAFIKLGARRYLVISIAMVAARIARDEDDLITEAAIAVGSCAATAKRLRRLEQTLIGSHVENVTIGQEVFDALSPITDIRATSDYRNLAAQELVTRCFALTLL